MRDNSFIMNTKSILRVAAFSTAFIVSAAFAGIFADKTEIESIAVITPTYNSKPTSCFGHRKNVASDAVAAAKINRILKTDDDNGRARSAKVQRLGFGYESPFAKDSSFDAFADATARYAEQSGKIEAADLSPEFNAAWTRHMKAWSDYADFLQTMKISSVRQELGAKAFQDFDREYDGEISRSWDEVLRIADKNGVDAEKYRTISD